MSQKIVAQLYLIGIDQVKENIPFNKSKTNAVFCMSYTACETILTVFILGVPWFGF